MSPSIHMRPPAGILVHAIDVDAVAACIAFPRGAAADIHVVLDGILCRIGLRRHARLPTLL